MPEPLERIATAIEVLVGDVERRRREAEENQQWERVPLGWMGPQRCPYCKRERVALLARGVQIFGCEGCIGEHLRSART